MSWALESARGRLPFGLVYNVAAMPEDIKKTVRDFILTTYLAGESPENLPDDTPLQSTGILDSLPTVGLVKFLEHEFGIELDLEDTSIERFERLDDIFAPVT